MRVTVPTGHRALRSTLILLAAGLAGSCGGGGDVTGPPNGPGGDAVASVEVTPETLNLAPGQASQLTATPRAADGTALTGRSIAWASTDEAVATVDGSGRVTAVAAGQVEVTATSEGKRGAAAVTVSQHGVATVEVVPDPSSVAVGKTAQLTAVTKAADGEELPGRPVTWATSDIGIATVSASGVVTGVAAGEVTITAASEGKSGTSRLTVSPVAVATVEVDPATATVPEGGTVTLAAVAKDENGTVLPDRPATWISSSPAVARIDAVGEVTALTAGTTTITATIEGESGTATVTVVAPTGTIRIWKGGASGEWSAAANWEPRGAPIPLDTVRVPPAPNAAVLTDDVEVAQLRIEGGAVRTAGHALIVKAKN